jgi:hypothetical protein
MCFGLIGIIYLLLTIILQPLSIILVDFCEILEPAFTDEKQFNATVLPYAKNFEDIFKPCLFGDGNLKSALPIGD